MSLNVKNVSQVVGEIKNLLESEYANVSIEGEITNLSLSSAGHWYFTLSDKDSALSAALFKMDALRNPIMKMIKDGAKVIVSGDISVYPKRGTFQVIVKKIVPIGIGDLKEQFEKLKRKLAAEGLFDIDRKKNIPAMPKRVAIITAQRGAALQDFINIYKRRSIWMDLLVIPAVVQGSDAPRSIRSALHNAIKYSQEAPYEKKVDLIVIARGGGSLEDLWAFNDEGLAYDIFNCPIPTISAVGHEVDFSISDFVADMRAETPSSAAEVVTGSQTMIKEKMITLKGRLKSVMLLKISQIENRLKRAHPNSILNIILKNVSDFQRKLSRCDIQKRLHELTKIHQFYFGLDENLAIMQQILKDKIKAWTYKINNSHDVLKALNPKNVLERGYGFLETENGRIVGSAVEFDELPREALLSLQFYDGKRKIKSNEV